MIDPVQPDTKLPKMKKVKEYVALLNQTDTNAPVATVLQNTLGQEVVWTRDSQGIYIGTAAGAFKPEHTALEISQPWSNFLTSISDATFPDSVSVNTRQVVGGTGLEDGILYNTVVRISVYNIT